MENKRYWSAADVENFLKNLPDIQTKPT